MGANKAEEEISLMREAAGVWGGRVVRTARVSGAKTRYRMNCKQSLDMDGDRDGDSAETQYIGNSVPASWLRP